MNHPSLSVLIPAAGASKRLGQAKQLVEYQGKALIQNAVDIAQTINPVEILVVTGANAGKVKAAVPHSPVHWLHNPDWSSGMGGSIALGATEIRPESDGLMIFLCDQWRIQAHDLWNLVDRWRTSPKQIVCARSKDINMPPVIFPKNCYGQLRKLSGDRGARSILKTYSEQLRTIPMESAIDDLDTQVHLDEMGSG